MSRTLRVGAIVFAVCIGLLALLDRPSVQAQITSLGPPFSDAFALVAGSADRSKRVRFEVDGLTTGTTRVVTIPDANVTIPTFAPGSVTWAMVDKTGSSLADLATRAVTNLSDGANVPLLNANNVFTGTLGNGPTTPVSGTHVHFARDADMTFRLSSAGTGGFDHPIVQYERYRGTNASPAATVAADKIATINFVGWTTARNVAAQIIAYAATGWSANLNDAPGELAFLTTPDGSGTSAERLRLGTDGIRTVGTAPTVANVGANSCGTTAATLAGNQNAGAVTVGATSGTQCRITLPAAPTRWHCTASNETTANLVRAVAVSTTSVDLVGTFVAGDVVTYVCFPR